MHYPLKHKMYTYYCHLVEEMGMKVLEKEVKKPTKASNLGEELLSR